MAKPKIVLVDNDEKYLIPLELKIIEELYEKIDLEIITNASYFNEFFSSPKKIDILVISEDLFNEEIQRQNINHMFVLTEQSQKDSTGDLSINKIYKYTSVKEIYNEIIYNSNSNLFVEKKESKGSKVILVYSPIGGCGKTTVAIGISACLAQSFKKVLYINAEPLQTFQYFLTNKGFLSSDLYKQLRTSNTSMYDSIKVNVRNEIFSYIPPFSSSLSSLNVDFAIYKNLIMQIKQSQDYDFIIVDVSSEFTDDKAELISLAEKVIVLTQQDNYSVMKTEALLNNINCSDEEKFIFVCNKYNKTVFNAIVSSNYVHRVKVSEYISFQDGIDSQSIEKMTQNDDFSRLTYMFI